MTDHVRYVNEVGGMFFRPARFLGLVRDAPTPAEFHGPGGELAHLWQRNGAVSLLDQHALNAAHSKLDSKGQTDGAATADEHRYFSCFCHSQTSPAVLCSRVTCRG